MADIFRLHGAAYQATHALTPAQSKVMRDIVACRTAVLGGHVEVCDHCGHQENSYNSCRNRHCPKCQCLRQAIWVDQRSKRVLPTNYFHVVFTVPHELNALALYNQRWFYSELFADASQTLLQLAQDPDRLGAQIGITAVLHTWTRDLRFHPHLHCIVTGGGLCVDRPRWIDTRQNHLFPVEVMAKLFRGKLLDSLARAWSAGGFDLRGPCHHLCAEDEFFALKDQLYRKKWVVYAKRPFAGPQQVFRYLGRYTHRVAISNQRILSVGDDHVCFLTKNGQTATISPNEFIRRFLLHVLPDRFVKIRHYGLMAAGNVTSRLELARRILLPYRTEISPALAVLLVVALFVMQLARPLQLLDWRQRLELLTGVDLSRCRMCGGKTTVQLVAAYWDTS